MAEQVIRIFLLQHYSVQVAGSSNPTSKTSYRMEKLLNPNLKVVGTNFPGQNFAPYYFTFK